MWAKKFVMRDCRVSLALVFRVQVFWVVTLKMAVDVLSKRRSLATQQPRCSLSPLTNGLAGFVYERDALSDSEVDVSIGGNG